MTINDQKIIDLLNQTQKVNLDPKSQEVKKAIEEIKEIILDMNIQYFFENYPHWTKKIFDKYELKNENK
jgi:hypothetical protein